MNQLDKCQFCGHETYWHSGSCDAPNCNCQAFIPKNVNLQAIGAAQFLAAKNQRVEQIMEKAPSHRWIGRWVINYCWVAEIQDHGDGTCTVLKFDRTKTPPPFEEGSPVEDSGRVIVSIKTKKGQELKVLNPKHVFSYAQKVE